MTIVSAARRVARLLRELDCKVVFAESCTGGLVSGALTRFAGISNYHCGGVVVYRNESKIAFLDIPRKLLDKVGTVGPESFLVYGELQREAKKKNARCAGLVLLSEEQADLGEKFAGYPDTALLIFPLKKGELERAMDQLLQAESNSSPK